MDADRVRGSGERWYLSFFLSKFASGASVPLVPLFVITVLGGGIGAVTAALVSVSVATVPGYIIWGEYTDKKGRRRLPILVGMALMALAFLLMGLARDIPTFILANALYGFFLTATVPSSTMLVTERNPKEDWGRAIGAFARVGGLGWMVGMVAGALYFALVPGWLGIEVAMRGFMLTCAAISAVAWATAAAWLEEPGTRMERRWLWEEAIALRTWAFEKARHIPSKMIYALRPRVIRKARRLHPGWGRELDTYLIATFILFVGVQVFYVPFPVMLTGPLELGSAQVFAVYLASALASASMYAWAGREVDLLGNRRSQLVSWGARAAIFPAFSLALLAMAWGHAWAALAIAIALNGLAGSMFAVLAVAGTTTTTDLAPDQIRGEALGAYNAVIGLGMIVGAFAGGAIASALGYHAVFAATGLLTLVSALLLFRLSLH